MKKALYNNAFFFTSKPYICRKNLLIISDFLIKKVKNYYSIIIFNKSVVNLQLLPKKNQPFYTKYHYHIIDIDQEIVKESSQNNKNLLNKPLVEMAPLDIIGPFQYKEWKKAFDKCNITGNNQKIEYKILNKLFRGTLIKKNNFIVQIEIETFLQETANTMQRLIYQH